MHEKIDDLKPTMDQVQASQEEIETSLSQLMKEHSLMVSQSQVLDSLYEREAEAEEIIQNVLGSVPAAAQSRIRNRKINILLCN